MGAFLGAVLGGQNTDLGADINQAGGISTFGTGVGEGDVSADSAFQNTLLGGNTAAEAKLLAPQIKTMQDQANQKLQTTAQFGDRSGGTNASNQTTADTTRSNVDDMISKLTGSAATNLGNLGTAEQQIGLNANQTQAQESQDQLQNFQNSLLGKGIGEAAQFGETAGLGGLGGSLPGGPGAAAGAQGALSDFL